MNAAERGYHADIVYSVIPHRHHLLPDYPDYVTVKLRDAKLDGVVTWETHRDKSFGPVQRKLRLKGDDLWPP